MGIQQQPYQCATQSGMAVSCNHRADYKAQDIYLINPDNQLDIWRARPNAYRVPIGYRPGDRLPNCEFNQRTGRTFPYTSQMRTDGNDTNQFTPYPEMFSAKLPKRFTTTDYLMQW